MPDPVYLSSPQIHLFAFQHRYQVDSNSPYLLATTAWIKDKYREILDHFYVFQPLRLNPKGLESQTDNLIDPQFSLGHQYQTFLGTINTNYGLRLIKGKVYARQYGNSYILNLNLAESQPQSINTLAQLRYLNPNNCLISKVDNQDLGQAILFSACVKFLSQSDSNLLRFAQRCLAALLEESDHKLVVSRHGQFLNGYLFEFNLSHTSVHNQPLLVWLYPEAIEPTSLEIAFNFVANLLLGAQEIKFNAQSSQSKNSFILQDWMQLKTDLLKLQEYTITNKPVKAENSLSQLKRKIELIQSLSVEYYRLIQQLKQSDKKIGEPRQEYDYQLQLFQQALPQANLNFWHDLGQTNQTIEQKIKHDLEDIQQEYNLLNQAVETVKTAVEIEQTLATRKLQKTIVVVAIGIGVGLICQNIQLTVALDYNNWNPLGNSITIGAIAALIVYGIIYLQQSKADRG